MSDEDFQWTREGDPHWVDTYLEALRAGELIKVACVIAGTSETTAWRWRQDDERNESRHTRALHEGKARVAHWAGKTLKEQAERGSSWHFARYMALKDADTYKEMNVRLRDAEPDTDRVDVTGDAAQSRRVADERLEELEGESLSPVPEGESPENDSSSE